MSIPLGATPFVLPSFIPETHLTPVRRRSLSGSTGSNNMYHVLCSFQCANLQIHLTRPDQKAWNPWVFSYRRNSGNTSPEKVQECCDETLERYAIHPITSR
jgi:hypothetical protein